MKYRCQCPKPEGVRVPYPQYPHYWNIHFDNNILHFKKATHFCERCGVGICEKCGTREKYIIHDWDNLTPIGTAFGKEILCQSCAELEEK